MKNEANSGRTDLRSLVFRTLGASVAAVLLMLSVAALWSCGRTAPNVVIAAVDSPATWKSQASVVCDGVSDQVEINAKLAAGSTVTLAPGTYQVDGYINMTSGTRLTGQGNATVINLIGTAIMVPSVSNVELDHFKLTGSETNPVATVGVFVIAWTADVSGISVHDVYCAAKGGTDFYVYAGSGRKVSKVSFVRDTADSPDGIGFALNGEGTSPLVEDVTFYRCTALNSGVAPTRLVYADGEWESGWDLAEYPGMTVNRIYVIKSSSDYSWEDAYHFEYMPKKTNVVMIDNYAEHAGIKPNGIYSCGYLLAFRESHPDDIVFSGNTGYANRLGDVKVSAGGTGEFLSYTPAMDMVINPSNPSESFVRVNQGNLVGVVITSGDNKTLVVYSSDGNPVSQSVELGGTYAAADGQSYTFSGTKINVQFSDYAVIRLVKTAEQARR